MLVPNEVNMIEVSDDEDGDGERMIMPPPAMAPPMAVKKDKKPAIKKQTKKSESEESESRPKRATRSKQVPKVKQEPKDDSEDEAISDVNNRDTMDSTSSKSSVKSTKAGKKQAANISAESVYEDAVSEQATKNLGVPAPVETGKPLSSQDSDQLDATFVTTVASSQNANEILEPRATYVVPKNESPVDATFFVAGGDQPINDQTVVIDKPTLKKKTSACSIMTEDDSDTASSPITKIPQASLAKGKSKELFK